MRNESWKKLKPWVIQGLLLLGIGGLFWWGIRPFQERIHTKMDEIQKIDVLREHKSRQMQRLPELEKQNALIEEQGRALEIVLTKDQLVEFIRTLERLAAETGAEIEIASKDNTLLESKITAPAPAKPQEKVPGGESAEETASTPVAPKRGNKPVPIGLLNELPLKNYIRLTLGVEAPYRVLASYLHKLETLSYATEIIGITMKEREKEREETAAASGEAPLQRPSKEGVVLKTEFDMLIYTKE